MSDMPTIITFSEDIASAEAPKPLPAGEYPAVITAVEVKESQKGTTYVSAQFVISPDHFPADFDAEAYPDGMTLSYNRLSAEDNPRARFSMRKFVEAIGAPAAKTIDVSEWVGLPAIVRLKTTVYEGIDRNEIDKVSKP